VRPGTISGHSGTGASSSTDFLNRFLKCILTLKCAPSHPQAFWSMTPVDFVSQIITSLALGSAAHTQAYHPICSHPSLSLAEVIAALNFFLEGANRRGSCGPTTIKTVSFNEWKSRLRDAAEHTSSLRLLLPFFDSGGLPVVKEETVFSEINCRALCRDLHLKDCPRMTRDHIVRYAQFYQI